MRNIENTLLLPDPSPVIKLVVCETCGGSGIYDNYEEAITCPDCNGWGEVEIWR